jgi:outer membrane lipoprotein-sorting protein
MKTHRLIVLSSGLALLGFAAGPGAAPVQDLVAPFLQRINARTRQISSFSARFRQTSVDPTFAETDTASGHMCFLRKAPTDGQPATTYLVRFDYLTPEKSVTIMNDAKVILWQPGAAPQEHAMVNNLTMRTLLAGLTSLDELHDQFLISLTSQSLARVTLKLTPASDIARRTFRELFVTFDKHSWLPVAVQQNKLNGERVTLQFEEPVINRSIRAELFTLDFLKRQISATPTSSAKAAPRAPAPAATR